MLEFPGLGHDVLAASGCATTVTVDFLERPGEGYDTSCVERMTVPPFTTGG